MSGQHIFSSDVYFVSNLPSQLQGGDVALICTAGFVMSFLATVYPAWRAAKVAKKCAAAGFQPAPPMIATGLVASFSKPNKASTAPAQGGWLIGGMAGQLLGAQIDACHEIGVKCPIYYTVGWSATDAETHPEWCARKR